MKKQLNKQAVEAIRKHYSCQGKHPCCDFAHCQFGDGENPSFDFGICGADEFYEGYVQALKDKEETK